MRVRTANINVHLNALLVCYAVACASGVEIVYRAIERENSPVIVTIITTFVLAVIFWIPASIAMDAQRERRLREAMEQHPVFAFLFLLFNIFLASKGYATPKDSRITKCWLRLLSILQSKASHEDMLDALEERYFIQVVTTGYAAAQKWRRDQIWNSLKPLLQQKVYSCFRWIAKTVLPIVLRTLADHFLKRIGF